MRLGMIYSKIDRKAQRILKEYKMIRELAQFVQIMNKKRKKPDKTQVF